MYKISDFTKESYKVGEVAEFLRISPQTIRVYDQKGYLKTFRSDGNHRMVARDEVIRILRERDLLESETDNRIDVIYARVSSHDQKAHGDLDRQALYAIETAPSVKNPVIMKEVGSSLDDKRPQLQELLKKVCNNEVRTIYVTCKDRLTRFGFNYLETVCNAHGTNIVVLHNPSEEKSVQTELVEDMMSLIACFSGKLYEMRSRRKKSEE